MADKTEETPSSTPTTTPETDWQADQIRLMHDLGLAVGETPEPPPPVQETVTGRTLAEHSIILDEQAKTEGEKPAEEEKPGEEKPLAKEGETPSEPEKPAETPAAPEETKAGEEPPKQEEKPVVVEKRKPTEEIVKELVRKAMEGKEKGTPAPAEKTDDKPKADDYEASLDDGQKDELAIARMAAKKNPEKHGKLPEKLLAFYKKTDEYAQKVSGEERSAEEAEADFQKFLKQNKPEFSVTDRRRYERELIVEDARNAAKEELKGEFDEVKQKQKVLELQPKIEATVNEFTAGLEGLLLESEQSAPILKRAREVGWQKAVEEDPIFAPVVAQYQERALQLASEYTVVFSGAKPFNQNNPDHVWLIEFIRNQGAHFAKNGGDARVKNGKEFLPVAEYWQKVAQDSTTAERHWTFETRDVLSRLATNTQWNIQQIIKTEEEKLQKAGYSRQKPGSEPAPAKVEPAKKETPAPAKVDEKKEEVSPKAKTSTSPGPAKTAGVTGNKAMDDWAMKALGLPAS